PSRWIQAVAMRGAPEFVVGSPCPRVARDYTRPPPSPCRRGARVAVRLRLARCPMSTKLPCVALLTALMSLSAVLVARSADADPTCAPISPRAGELDATFGTNGMARI